MRYRVRRLCYCNGADVCVALRLWQSLVGYSGLNITVAPFFLLFLLATPTFPVLPVLSVDGGIRRRAAAAPPRLPFTEPPESLALALRRLSDQAWHSSRVRVFGSRPFGILAFFFLSVM